MEVSSREWAAVASEISGCQQQLSVCERSYGHDAEPYGLYVESDDSRLDRHYLGYRLKQAHYRMLLLIERLGLSLFHADYHAGFSQFNGKLDEVIQTEYDSNQLISNPLNYIEQRFEALTALLRGGTDRELSGLSLLESILQQTPHLLNDFSIDPGSENDVQKALFNIIRSVFPDCKREKSINHIFKTYKSDFGISSIKTLIEIKYADSEAELKNEIDGIYADMRGYSGDHQWKNFFALFYTTKAIAAQSRIDEEFKLANADISWKPIIVHGTGHRRTRGNKPSGAEKQQLGSATDAGR